MRRKWAFTLIELLIVVAIIAILAAIAVPNFIEAQARSKVSRVQADMRSLATAIEAYCVDNNKYPSANNEGTAKWLAWVSTPVAYITTAVLNDPFTPRDFFSNARRGHIRYYGFNNAGYLNADSDSGEILSVYSDIPNAPRIEWYALFSHGPDGERNNLSGTPSGTFLGKANMRNVDNFVHYIYDTTNGTVSNGEVFRAGGSPSGETAVTARLIIRTQ